METVFIGTVDDLGNGTGLDMVINRLQGTSLGTYWNTDTDLLLLCVMQTGRFCVCRPNDHYSRYVEKLNLSSDDAILLAKWMQKNLEIP